MHVCKVFLGIQVIQGAESLEFCVLGLRGYALIVQDLKLGFTVAAICLRDP